MNFWLTDSDSDIAGYLEAKIGSRSDAPSLVRAVTNTEAGPSSGVQATRVAGGSVLQWLTPPLDGTDLTAAAWTLHLWTKESNLAANAAVRFQALKYTNVEGASALDNNAGTELTVTIADSQITTGVATVTALAAGDRLVFKVLFDDAGTMATGYNATLSYNGESANAEGDTYVTCPDTIAIQFVTPATSRTRVQNYLKDDATSNQLLTATQVNQAIDAAVREYSQDRPRMAYGLASGDGAAYDFRLPRFWVWGLSFLDEIEHPTGDQIRTLVDQNEWEIYESALGLQPVRKIRFRESTPNSGTDNIQFKYSALHIHNDKQDTVPYADYDAVMWLAASYAALSLAGKMSQSVESTLAADSADYRGGQTRWEAMAKRYRELYLDHIGAAGDTAGGLASGTGRAVAVQADWDVNLQQPLGDRLMHSRRFR